MSNKLGTNWDWPKDMTFPEYFRNRMARRYGKAGYRRLLDTVMNNAAEYVNSQLEQVAEEKRPAYRALLVFNAAMIGKVVRTFVFSEGILNALKATELGSIPEELVKTPFPKIYFDLTRTTLNPVLKNGGRDPEDIRHPRGCLLGKTVLKDRHHLTLLPCSYTPNRPGAHDLEPYSISYIGLSSKDGAFEFIKDTNELDDSDKEVLTLAINALLYINSSNAEIKEEWVYAPNLKGKSKKAKKAGRQLQRKRGKFFKAGFNIQLPQHSDICTSTGKTGRKLEVRFQSRGHWRDQWYGPRKDTEGNKQAGSYQKIKWIPPCWKGPEMADLVHRDYDVHSKPTMKEGRNA